MSMGYQPETKSKPKTWALIVVAIVGVLFILLVLGVIYLINSPDGDVKMANEMEDYAAEYIQKHHLVSDDEELVAYYDATLACDGTEAAILTTLNLKYHKNGKNTTFPLAEILEVTYQDDLFGGTIEVENKNGQFMKIEIPVSNAKSFYTALKKLWERKREKLNPEAAP